MDQAGEETTSKGHALILSTSPSFRNARATYGAQIHRRSSHICLPAQAGKKRDSTFCSSPTSCSTIKRTPPCSPHYDARCPPTQPQLACPYPPPRNVQVAELSARRRRSCQTEDGASSQNGRVHSSSSVITDLHWRRKIWLSLRLREQRAGLAKRLAGGECR